MPEVQRPEGLPTPLQSPDRQASHSNQSPVSLNERGIKGKAQEKKQKERKEGQRDASLEAASPKGSGKAKGNSSSSSHELSRSTGAHHKVRQGFSPAS